MSRGSFAEMSCSLARAVDVVGDTWTPLVLRDLFLGVDTFEAIVSDLGISRALLVSRLDALEAGGVVERERYRERPERFRYRLTAAGRELVPILVALTQWGDRWRAPDGPPIVFRHDCGHRLDVAITCPRCDRAVSMESLTPLPGPGGRAAVGTRVVAEVLSARIPAREARRGAQEVSS